MRKHNDPQAVTLRDYLQILRRRRRIVLATLIAVPLAVAILSFIQEPQYQASAEVLLSRQNLANTLTGTPDPVFQSGEFQRIAQTQADLASAPVVAKRVLAAGGLPRRDPNDFSESSSVLAKADSDLLEFSVTDQSETLAIRLATEYARQFTIYRRELDTFALQRARTELARSIQQLVRERKEESQLYSRLVDKEQQLRTLEALQTSNAFVVRPADEAEQIQPRPVRNVSIALVLGGLLGLGLAFLRESLDTRVRSADEITELLGLPLLARIPEPERRLKDTWGLSMLEEPTGTRSEAFRMLRTNLEFTNLERGARVIMVSSAIEQEGKSTTVANLAVALARAGRSVLLVDLDLRRPTIARLFDLSRSPGVTDVALGHAELDAAIIQVPIQVPPIPGLEWNSASPQSPGRVLGALSVLPTGSLPPNPGEFIDSGALADILMRLRERRDDFILIDAPPLLHVGDAFALSARVDSLLAVARLGIVNRTMLRELRRVLQGVPATKLGYVLTGAQNEDAYGYGSYYSAPEYPEIAAAARVG